MHTVNLKQKGPKKRVATRVVTEVLNGRLVNKLRFEFRYFTLKRLCYGNFNLSTILFDNVEMSPPPTQVCQLPIVSCLVLLSLYDGTLV